MNNNAVLILFIAGTLLLTLFAFFLIAYLIVQKNKQNKFRQEKEELKLEILRTGMEVQEQAMNKISQELHDGIGSRLNSIKRNLAAAEMPMDAATARDLKKQAGVLLDEVIKDARNISHMLNSDYITRNGLVASVQKELEDISRTVKIDCSFEVQGDYYSLDDERELLVFRMVQEAINNVVKHAQATRLSVLMDYHENDFTVTINDNGKGFDTKDLAEGSGIGLMNMRNRAGMIKGTLAVDSGDKGTSIKLSIKI